MTPMPCPADVVFLINSLEDASIRGIAIRDLTIEVAAPEDVDAMINVLLAAGGLFSPLTDVANRTADGGDYTLAWRSGSVELAIHAARHPVLIRVQSPFQRLVKGEG